MSVGSRTIAPTVGAAAFAAAVLALLLAPRHVELPIIWLTESHLLGDAMNGGSPLWWTAQNVSNAALFLPLGWLLTRVLRRPLLALALSAAVSAGCELAQTVIPNRVGSLLDIAMNVMGAAIGAGLGAWGLHRARRRAAEARRSADPSGSADPGLAAGAAGPVDVAGGGVRRLHAVQADGTVRGVEGGVVVDGLDRTPGPRFAALSHRTTLSRSADTGAQNGGSAVRRADPKP